MRHVIHVALLFVYERRLDILIHVALCLPALCLSFSACNDEVELLQKRSNISPVLG